MGHERVVKYLDIVRDIRDSILRTSNTVINTNQRLSPQQTQSPRSQSDALQRATHSWSFGIANAIYILYRYPGLMESFCNDFSDIRAVMLGRVLR